eukprot:4045359-Amphidinium_carterae.2
MHLVECRPFNNLHHQVLCNFALEIVHHCRDLHVVIDCPRSVLGLVSIDVFQPLVVLLRELSSVAIPAPLHDCAKKRKVLSSVASCKVQMLLSP